MALHCKNRIYFFNLQKHLETNILMLIFPHLNFTRKLCVKLVLALVHVGGMFSCRHKYWCNARGVTRVTRHVAP